MLHLELWRNPRISLLQFPLLLSNLSRLAFIGGFDPSRTASSPLFSDPNSFKLELSSRSHDSACRDRRRGAWEAPKAFDCHKVCIFTICLGFQCGFFEASRRFDQGGKHRSI